VVGVMVLPVYLTLEEGVEAAVELTLKRIV
jgi:hypothetical protein